MTESVQPNAPADEPATPETDSSGTAPVGARHRSLTRFVTDEIRQAILTRRYAPGDRLVEDRLSAELAVSRIPIREALRSLAAEGLVQIQPRRGASVADISDQIAREMVEVRAILEGQNAALAARRRDPAVMAELRAVLERGQEAAKAGDAAALARLNAEYHDLLGKAGRNSIMGEILRGLRERTSLVFITNAIERAHLDWADHAAILAAVSDGDEALANLLAMRHVHRAAQAVLGKRAAS